MSPAPWVARPLTVLGATGSIGVNTLDVAQRLGIPIFAITGHSRISELIALAKIHRPTWVVVGDSAAAARAKAELDTSIKVGIGPEALSAVCTDPQVGTVVTAIVGAAGLGPTLAAVRAGKRIGLANKEPLVMAGGLIMGEARNHGATIIPVDSEHSAIFQCLEGHQQQEVVQLILTASGGPFRTRADLSQVTVKEALCHPTWTMGPKITIDSATLMNKALEVIEAHWLFAMPEDRLSVLIHPTSVVHSMVAYQDGSVLAQLGRPDMRTPIQYALTWPTHTAGPVAAPDFTALAGLTFSEPDRTRFPALDFARMAMRAGGTAPAAMNAANEVAVAAFLAGQIPFMGINAVVRGVLEAEHSPATSLDEILAADAQARQRASELCQQLTMNLSTKV